MRVLLFICACFLLLGMADLPIGYYTFLRIVVTIGSVAVVFNEFENGINLWIIFFGFFAVLFNPIIPIYFNDKSVWMPIDFIGGIIFAIKSLIIKQK